MTITTMSEHYLDEAVALTQALGWPHRREDWQQALALGEGLALVENGELLGTTLYWRWGDYATIGLVIVADKAQGKGFGKALMQAALAKLEGHQLRLHATVKGKGLYEKLGFATSGLLVQHQCRALAAVERIAPAASQTLRPAQQEDLARLSELESKAHGMRRPLLLDNLYANARRLLVLEEQGSISGFAGLRRSGHGYVIGPIVCRDVAQAKVLVSELLQGLEGEFVRIDTDSAYGLAAWLTSLGLAEVDASAIMYKGQPWQPQGVLAFGLMSQALA